MSRSRKSTLDKGLRLGSLLAKLTIDLRYGVPSIGRLFRLKIDFGYWVVISSLPGLTIDLRYQVVSISRIFRLTFDKRGGINLQATCDLLFGLVVCCSVLQYKLCNRVLQCGAL